MTGSPARGAPDRALSKLAASCLAICVAMLIHAKGIAAQTPPTPAQAMAYDALHRAAHDGNAGEIRRLAAQGADVDARDGDSRTPAHVAAFAVKPAALRALAEAGSDMNAHEGHAYDIVTIAAVANEPDLMSLAIELGNRADLITSPYNGAALIAEAHLGHAEVVRRLIAAGAPLDHVNNLGWTALIEAVILGNGGPDDVATVRALVAAGANTAIADRNGVTPLAHARARGFDEMARIIAR
ncbi:MAG: ankyrin repeat domain-containing protein [Alphaproteobacteria bacterium]|nr:ankyrin repeat domain-containing protein [Alphaproteobacteria bacterium]